MTMQTRSCFRAWSLLLVTLLFINTFAPVSVKAGDDDDEFEQELSSGFQCEFALNQPSWQFKMHFEGSEDEEYILQLSNIFELSIDSSTGLFVQTPILTSFSSIVWSGVDTSSTLFTMIGTPNNNQVQSSFDSISYQTQLPLTTDVNAISMSFLFTLNNYRWTSKTNDTSLVFVYSLVTEDDDQPQSYNYGNASYPNALLLDNVYFNVTSTTSNGLSVQTLFSGSELWVVYPHFTSSQLNHNGRFGFLNNVPYGPSDDDDEHHGWVVAAVLVPIAILALAGIYFYRRRRSSAFQEVE